MKQYDIRLEALCYTLEQIFTSHVPVVFGFGDSEPEWFEQLKAIVGEIEFRLEELRECYTHEEYVNFVDNAQKGHYDPDLVHDIKKATAADQLFLRRDIRKCRYALWRCANEPGYEVSIIVGNAKYTFYDHAALIQGLSDALGYFESEL